MILGSGCEDYVPKGDTYGYDCTDLAKGGWCKTKENYGGWKAFTKYYSRSDPIQSSNEIKDDCRKSCGTCGKYNFNLC